MQLMKQAGMATIALAALLLLSGCPASTSGSAYSRSQVREMQEVYLGYVENVRPVLIEGTDSGVGAVSGAALGGLAGSNIGQGKGQIAGAIGGAVIGGLIGSAIEEDATRQPGVEITVRLDSGRLIAVTQADDEPFYRGDRVQVLTGYDGAARVTRY